MMNDNMTKFMFDTNIFNRILDGKIDTKLFDSKNEYYITHIQLDELSATQKAERRRQLLKVFREMTKNEISTESAVWDISKWGKSKLGDANIYTLIKNRLDEKEEKQNNIQDALIAETSIKNHLTLVTTDENLLKVVKQLGGLVIDFEKFKKL